MSVRSLHRELNSRLRSERGEPGLLVAIFLVLFSLMMVAGLKAWTDYPEALTRVQAGVMNTAETVALNVIPWTDPATGEQSKWIDMSRAQATATSTWDLQRLAVMDTWVKQPLVNRSAPASVDVECVDLGPAPGLCGQVRVQVSEQFQGSLFAPVGVGRPTITREGFAKIRVNQ